MKRYLDIVFVPLVAVMVFGCAQEKKMDPVPVGEMQEYHDPGIGFSFNHPKGWIVNAQVGRVRLYNAQDVEQKFLVPTGQGSRGVEISVEASKVSNPAAQAQGIKDELKTSGVHLGQEEAVTVSGASGTKVPYTANWGGGNIIYGHRIFVPLDTMLYDLTFSGFGEFYGAYATIFDESLRSFKLPAPKEKGRDETLPSETLTIYDTKFFSFEYPENYNFTNAPKGTNDLVVELRGVRQDCSIRFDVFGAKGLTVDKVFEQNKGKYKATGTGSTTITGQPAHFLTYAATPTVERRFYFIVKNDKVIRVTMDWHKPQRDAYIPIYDKVIASIKLK